MPGTAMAGAGGAPARKRWHSQPATFRSAAEHAGSGVAPAPTEALGPAMVQLYFAIEAARAKDRPLIVQFMGVAGGEGVSTVAAGFARQAAREAQCSVLLVTCGEPSGTAPSASGLALPDLIDQFQAGRPLAGAPAARATDACAPREAALREEAEYGRTGLRFATLGAASEGHVNLRMLDDLAAALRQTFTVVVLDCPPATASPLAGVLSRIADGTVLVAAAGRTRRAGLERTIAAVAAMGGQVVGLVLNRQREWLPGWLQRRLA